MPIAVHQFACLSDNYGYLVRDQASGLAAAIDTPDAEAVLAAAARTGWALSLILNTHWHPDHAGGNAAVKAATGCRIVGPGEVTRIAPLDQEVREGDEVSLGETTFRVLDTGGHTLGHVSYHDPAAMIGAGAGAGCDGGTGAGAAFVGDTLFALGCGRLFEGTPAQMWTSLSKLAALPDDTLIYCAHEYTAANARFALSVDGGPALKARADQVFAARARGEPTVPTTIGAEKAANPFLRAPLLAAGLGLGDVSPAEAFAAVRAAKDAFQG